jgi:hypothetical protein
MLALPVMVGLLLRRADAVAFEPVLLPVVACWTFGYLAFHAITIWLKTPTARRARARRPVLAYALAVTALGGAAVLGAGPDLLGWGVVYTPTVTAALVLAAQRRERSVASGSLTSLAAGLMTLVTRFVTPGAFLDAWTTPSGAVAVLHAVLVFAYLFGTVLYVKTMIRERGRPGWVAASVGWHGVVLLATAVGAVAGTALAAWPGFFLLTVARAWLMPALARRRPVRPFVVGLVEIGLVAGFVAVSALA